MQLSDISPLSGIVGALVGALAAYLFGLRAEVAKSYQKLRTDSYVDFIRSVAVMAAANRSEDKAKVAEASILVADAKARIAIYGSRSVVVGLAKFFANPVLNSETALSSFADVVCLMRSETPGGKEMLEESNLRLLLFGPDGK